MSRAKLAAGPSVLFTRFISAKFERAIARRAWSRYSTLVPRDLSRSDFQKEYSLETVRLRLLCRLLFRGMSFEFNGATACFPSQLPRQHESRSHNDGWQGGPQNSFTAAGLTQTPGGAPIGIRSTACRLGPSSPVPLYPQAFHRYPPPTPLFRLPPSIICNRYWRMEKKQHMRWTQRGAQMLLHVSISVKS